MTVRAEQIAKEFLRERQGTNRFQAVKQTDFHLNGGEVAVMTGRSGSGKSTLLNMIAGLLVPTSGKIFIDDVDIYSLSDKELSKLRNTKIGVIPQGQTALHSLNVLENVCLPCTLYGEEMPEAFAMELLERLDIADLRDVMPSELSGGEMRRMAIARALIKKPSVILADEPTGDLDDENTKIVFEFLKSIAKEQNSAVFIVTHENDGANYADKLYSMNAGIITENI